MTRCHNTTTPRQHLGRKRYRLARREMRCVREEGHEGPCAFELQHDTSPTVTGPGVAVVTDMRHEPAEPVAPSPRTPEQIAESDARYREMLRRRRAR